jgi:hypothetical protein
MDQPWVMSIFVTLEAISRHTSQWKGGDEPTGLVAGGCSRGKDPIAYVIYKHISKI